MSQSKAQPASTVLLVEVPPQLIALCEASGAGPQAALRNLGSMLCGLRYDAYDRPNFFKLFGGDRGYAPEL